jgi:protein SERAC1
MWLRDSLPHDLPGARIMLYGYDTKVSGSDSFQDLEALATTLRSHLQILAAWKSESRTVPLIFIAHSLGGLVVKEAIIQLKRDPGHQAILASIYGALFFGVPNQGMDIKSLVAMVKGQPNQALIYLLDPESQVLREQSRHFQESFDCPDSKVVCFYETLKSPTAKQISLVSVMPIDSRFNSELFPGWKTMANDRAPNYLSK